MGQVRHGSATTTFTGKAAIQPENSRNKRERYGGTDQRLFKHLRKRTISQKKLEFYYLREAILNSSRSRYFNKLISFTPKTR